MKIIRLISREIYDSRGFPTIECDLMLEDGTYVSSYVPAGASCSQYEAHELRDGGARFMGKGVTKAVEKLEQIIAPILIGKEPEVVNMDVMMLELDGTDDKSNLGANTILAVSMAVLKAQAAVEDLHEYELIAHLCGLEAISLPLPMFNMINGGKHANNDLHIQEFLVVPVDVSSFREAMESSLEVSHELKSVLLKKNKFVAVGDEGGYSCNFKDENEALDSIMEAIENTQSRTKSKFVLALDVAASQFYDEMEKNYSWHSKTLSSEKLIKYYENLVKKYPIYSIEDGLAESDIAGWQLFMETMGDKVQIVGDDIFATNAQRIWEGLEKNLASAAIIKPNQIGTVTETLQAIKLCKENGVNVIVSHRSGETNDTFIADLAVGTSASHIKAGGCSRGERMAKYNHLLRIEDELVLSLLDA